MSHFTTVWLKENQVRLVGSSRSFTCNYIQDPTNRTNRSDRTAPPSSSFRVARRGRRRARGARPWWNAPGGELIRWTTDGGC